MLWNETLEMSTPFAQGLYGDIAERFVGKQLIHRDYRRSVLFAAYGFDPLGGGAASCSLLRTKPSKLPRGKVKKRPNPLRSYICGWHGDYVILANSADYGKRALVVEVKYGRRQFSAGEQTFFRDVVRNPERYLKSLIEVKILIVSCHSLTLGGGTMETRWEEFNEEWTTYGE